MDEHGYDYILGVELACNAAHVATLADTAGRLVWSNYRFRTSIAELQTLWAKVPARARLLLVMEPTRNAWVPLAAWFRARGVTVILVPPEQSADLRRSYQKHTKNDRLDSVLLARLPLLHPDGLNQCQDLGPADPLRRTVRRRAKLVQQRHHQLEPADRAVGAAWPGLSRGAGRLPGQQDRSGCAEPLRRPSKLLRTPVSRLVQTVAQASRGHHGPVLVGQLRAAATEAVALYGTEGIDFAELAADIVAETRSIATVQDEIDHLDQRIERLYTEADPDHIAQSVPGVGPVLAPTIHGLFGDPRRFANLGAARAFTGLVPGTTESGISQASARPTKAGDPGLRTALFMAADLARQIDPTLAAKYRRLVVDRKLHHNSAICHLAAVLATRIVACLRAGTPYQLRDPNGGAISAADGRKLCDQLRVQPHERQRARHLKTGQTKTEVATRLIA